MILVLTAIALGLIVGLATGGSVRSLGDIHFRLWPLALLGLALQVIPVPSMDGDLDQWLAVGLFVASYVVLLIFVGLNWRHVGMPLMAVGFFLNALVIGINGGMPVSEAALRSAAGPLAPEAIAHLNRQGGLKHHLAGEGDVLVFLADVIPVGSPIRQVLSIGDVLSLVGTAWLLAGATRAQPVSPSQPAQDPLAPTEGSRTTP